MKGNLIPSSLFLCVGCLTWTSYEHIFALIHDRWREGQEWRLEGKKTRWNR